MNYATGRWASGLTVIYAEGALGRARTRRASTTESDQLRVLYELIEVLDRRVPTWSVLEKRRSLTTPADSGQLPVSASRACGTVMRTAVIAAPSVKMASKSR